MKKRFRTLQWKLTLTYTLVTVGALFALELLILGGAIILVQQNKFSLLPVISNGISGAIVEVIRDQTPQGAPDSNLLRQEFADLGLSQSFPSVSANDFANTQPGAPAPVRIVLVDNAGNLLATLPDLADSTVYGRPFNPELAPWAETLLSEAISAEFATADYSLDGYFRATQALSDGLNTPVGALAIAINIRQYNLLTTQVILLVLGGSLLLLTLAAGLLGTPFGWLVARGLTRRITQAAGAAAAWSKGNFSAQINDPQQDELGQLGRDLNGMAGELQSLLHTRQELSALEERNRIARDLHDSIKQQAFALAAQLGAARVLGSRDPQAALAGIAEAEALAQQLRQDLTALVLELRPPAMAGKDLPAAIKEYAAQWERQTGIAATVQVLAERKLPFGHQTALFRIIQEALSNIARHSGATHAWLELVYARHSVQLSVRDDGQGFDPADLALRGVGLQSVQERARLLGGQVEIRSTPGQGTTLTITCKLED